jgi:hypothetical protein
VSPGYSVSVASSIFGALPGVSLAVVGPRTLVQIKHESWVKIKPDRTGYVVSARSGLGHFAAAGMDVRRLPSTDSSWQAWRAFSDDALRSFLAALFPAVRSQALRASTNQRLKGLLDGSRSSVLADVTKWEFWDGLSQYLREFPPSGDDDGAGSARLAGRLATFIAKGGKLREPDLKAGLMIAETALRHGFEPPFVESILAPMAPEVEVFDTVQIEQPTRSDREPRNKSGVRACIHGYPPEICHTCGRPRTRRRQGL